MSTEMSAGQKARAIFDYLAPKALLLPEMNIPAELFKPILREARPANHGSEKPPNLKHNEAAVQWLTRIDGRYALKGVFCGNQWFAALSSNNSLQAVIISGQNYWHAVDALGLCVQRLHIINVLEFCMQVTIIPSAPQASTATTSLAIRHKPDEGTPIPPAENDDTSDDDWEQVQPPPFP